MVICLIRFFNIRNVNRMFGVGFLYLENLLVIFLLFFEYLLMICVFFIGKLIRTKLYIFYFGVGFSNNLIMFSFIL